MSSFIPGKPAATHSTMMIHLDTLGRLGVTWPARISGPDFV